MVSVGPPAGYGTTNVIFCVGQSVCATQANEMPAAMLKTIEAMLFTDIPY